MNTRQERATFPTKGIEEAIREADRDRARRYRIVFKGEFAAKKRQRGVDGYRPSARPQRIYDAWARWNGAARRFKGLDAKLLGQTEFRNIRLSTHGYQVTFSRNGRYLLTRHFAGFSEESLRAAKKFRDQKARELGPTTRSNMIPSEVLNALGLEWPVKGVSRLPQRSCYRVAYQNSEGKRVPRSFYYRHVSEVDAYAAAIAFRKEMVKERAGK